MKKIINAKVYDTDTARHIGWWENEQSDLDYVQETLYCKRTGEYFLYGEGGARTKYSTMQGANSWSSGEMIIPLTYDAAREWAENHLETEKYLKEFEIESDDESKTKRSFYISNMNVEKLKEYARKNELSVSESLDKLLYKALK